jgi:hypothetical protein
MEERALNVAVSAVSQRCASRDMDAIISVQSARDAAAASASLGIAAVHDRGVLRP